MKKILPLIFLAVSAFSTYAQSIRAVDTLAEVLAFPQHSALQPYYYVQGRNAVGDNGGGMFKYVPGSTATVDDGLVFSAVGGRILRVIEPGPIRPEWWGATYVSSNVPTVSATVPIQKAIDYAEASGRNHVKIDTAGGFLLTEPLYITSTLFEGAKKQSAYVSWPYEGTTFVVATNFTPGPEYAAIVITTPTVNKQSATPKLQNFTLVGHKAWTQRDPKVITAVSNRFSIFVATNDLPVAPPNPTVWPYYGHIFFYTSGDTHPAPYYPAYIGHAVVSNVNYATGEVLLDEEYGSPYATITNANFLTPGMTAVFSPIVSESARLIGNYVNVSPASAGIAGIAVVGDNIDTLQRSVYIKDLAVENFHVGIREGLGIHTIIDGIFVGGHAFAGIAGTHSFGHRDSHYKGDNYLSGFQRADWYTLNPTNMVDWSYARSAYGHYDLSAASYTGQTVVDGAVTGFYFQRSANIMADLFRVDQPIADAFHFGGTSASGSDDPNQADVVISKASALSIQSAYWPQTWRKTRHFIWSKPRTGYRNNVAINYAHEADFTSVGGTSRDFDYAFNIASGDKIQVIAGGLAAHSDVLAPNSARPILGSEGGFTEPIGTHWYRDVATGGINLSVRGTNRVRFNAGGRVFDTDGNIWRAGADSSTGITRTANTEKSFWLEMPTYAAGPNDTANSNFFMLFRGNTTATANQLILGETGGDITSPLTRIVLYGSETLNGEPHGLWDVEFARWRMAQSIFITNNAPYLRLWEMDAPANQGVAGLRTTTNGVFLSLWNDALSSAQNPIAILRSNTTPTVVQLRTRDRGLHVFETGANTNQLGIGPVLDGQEREFYRHESGLIYLPPLDLSSITNGGGGGGTNSPIIGTFHVALTNQVVPMAPDFVGADLSSLRVSGNISNVFSPYSWSDDSYSDIMDVQFITPVADTNYLVLINISTDHDTAGTDIVPSIYEKTENGFRFGYAALTASSTALYSYVDIIVLSMDYDDWIGIGGGSGSGITDGDKGDITVSGGGANWQVNPNVLTTNEFKLLIAEDLIEAGTNVVLTASGNKVVINSTATGGGFDEAGNYTPTGDWDFSGAKVLLPSGTLTNLVLPDHTDSILITDGSGNVTGVTVTNLGWVIGFSNGVPVPRPTVQIAVYSTPGTNTWTNEWWMSEVRVIVVGAGSGGGSGRRGAAGTIRSGGGGGAGGSYSEKNFQTSLLISNVIPVIVGAGGVGGGAVTTDNSNGENGGTSGATYFGGIAYGAAVYAGPAPGGEGGDSDGSSGANGSSLSQITGATGGNSSATGGIGGTASTGRQSQAGTGGGGGGGITSGDSPSAGGVGGRGPEWVAGLDLVPGGVGGAVGSVGGNGNHPGIGFWIGGTGGGGGGGQTNAPAGAGGNGAWPGGGGGGGGASLNGFASGAGGNGGDGLVVIIAR